MIVKSMGRHIGEAGAGKSGYHLKRKEEGCCSSKRILYLGYSGLKQDKWEWLKFLPGRLVSTTCIPGDPLTYWEVYIQSSPA